MFIEIPDHIVHNKLIFAFKVIETKNKHIWMVFPIFVKNGCDYITKVFSPKI